MSGQKQPQADKVEAMFVQSAHGLTSSKYTLTLNGIGRSTVASFSRRRASWCAPPQVSEDVT
jgi:hypothetical protein